MTTVKLPEAAIKGKEQRIKQIREERTIVGK
jgi:hypothetical protein